ncbi:MAG: DUF4231 domain-containing protein [Blastocatellales bacterium]
MLRRITLFKRMPMLVWRPKENEQIISLDNQNNYPDFKADFEILERELMPHFRQLDNESLRSQNQFRRQQLVLIAGGVIATTLGAIQTTNTNVKWPSIAQAAVAAFLTAVMGLARELQAQKIFLSNRIKAEMLRGEFFLFLGRVGNYANDADRVQNLIGRVADIEAQEL